MADIIQPFVYDDCEAVINMNGVAVWDASSVFVDGASLSISEFKSAHGVSESFIKGFPFNLAGMLVKVDRTTYAHFTDFRVNSTWSSDALSYSASAFIMMTNTHGKTTLHKLSVQLTPAYPNPEVATILFSVIDTTASN